MGDRKKVFCGAQSCKFVLTLVLWLPKPILVGSFCLLSTLASTIVYYKSGTGVGGRTNSQSLLKLFLLADCNI